MEIALLQQDIAWENVSENHRRAARLLEGAASRGARLAILPEMFSTGFSMDAGRLAQAPGGASEAFLETQARTLDLWIIASIPQAGTPKPRNMALVVSPKGTVAQYTNNLISKEIDPLPYHTGAVQLLRWPDLVDALKEDDLAQRLGRRTIFCGIRRRRDWAADDPADGALRDVRSGRRWWLVVDLDLTLRRRLHRVHSRAPTVVLSRSLDRGRFFSPVIRAPCVRDWRAGIER